MSPLFDVRRSGGINRPSCLTFRSEYLNNEAAEEDELDVDAEEDMSDELEDIADDSADAEGDKEDAIEDAADAEEEMADAALDAEKEAEMDPKIQRKLLFKESLTAFSSLQHWLELIWMLRLPKMKRLLTCL